MFYSTGKIRRKIEISTDRRNFVVPRGNFLSAVIFFTVRGIFYSPWKIRQKIEISTDRQNSEVPWRKQISMGISVWLGSICGSCFFLTCFSSGMVLNSI